MGDKKGLLMDLLLVLRRRVNLESCSLCLRVRRGSAWVEAEAVIRELRADERALPRLQPCLCEDCAAAILYRRERANQVMAA